MKNKKLLGNALLLLTAMIWGTAFVFQRVGMENIGPVTFTAARMALAAVAIGTLAFLTRRKEKAAGEMPEEGKSRVRNTVIGGICCGSFLTIATILQQKGLIYTTAGKAGFITAMYILMVPVISFVFLKKRYTWTVWLAVVLGMTGMYFLCINEGFSLAYGDIFIAVSALFFSFHILCCDYFVRLGNPLSISAIQFAASAVIAFVAALIMEEPGVDQLVSALVPIIYCGIVSGGIGYTLQMVAQKYTDPAIASILMSMESVFALIAGVIILNEQMSARELSGCVIMFIAIILVQVPSFKGAKSLKDKES